MKRSDIIERLRGFPYDKEDYRVITGGAMVLYGMRENTHDIDLSCTPEMADVLESQGYLCKTSTDGNRRFKIGEDIEVFESRLCGEPVTLEGIPVVSVEELAEMKRSLGREKDKKDLELIKEYLRRTGYRRMPREGARDIIGKTVRGVVDRPAGSRHPEYADLIYPINYGRVSGVTGGDGEEQDAYLLGADEPLRTFEGRVIAVFHRFDDVEDKWIVSLDGEDYTDEAILKATDFQEKYFKSELLR